MIMNRTTVVVTLLTWIVFHGSAVMVAAAALDEEEKGNNNLRGHHRRLPYETINFSQMDTEEMTFAAGFLAALLLLWQLSAMVSSLLSIMKFWRSIPTWIVWMDF